MKKFTVAVLCSAMAALCANGQETMTANAEICKWKDGKKAVYMLEFDDNLASQVTNVIPELVRRGMVGTFYINPGGWAFKSRKADWETKIPALGMVYGNHTFTHKGATSYKQIEEDLGLCQEEIARCFPDLRRPRLVSFGQPGGVPWKISAEETKKLFKKFNLIDRPPFYGFPFWPTKEEEALKTVDDALASGGMGHHDFHGVGGDYGTTPMPLFIHLLDKIETNRAAFWITDPVSCHKYLTERDSSSLTVVRQDANLFRLKLTCKTSSKLYDLPLSLRVAVPSGWTECLVTQGKRTERVAAADGAFICSVLPVSGVIDVTPAR